MQPPTDTPSQPRATIALLMTMTLLAVFPLDVVLPSFPALSSHFRTTPSDVAQSVSIFALGLAVSLLLIGPLSDMFGRKKLLLTGIALAAIGATGCLFAMDFAWFMFFRVIQAIGCGAFALSQALIQDVFAGRELERSAEVEAIRAALREGEASGQPRPFDPEAFKQRMLNTHG